MLVLPTAPSPTTTHLIPCILSDMSEMGRQFLTLLGLNMVKCNKWTVLSNRSFNKSVLGLASSVRGSVRTVFDEGVSGIFLSGLVC